MKILYPIYFLIFLILSACGNERNMARLDEADRLLDRNPDSALTIVRSIDPASLRNPEERGRHSLLLTMALLKTDPSVVSCSIFKPAWDYYRDFSEPSRETMLTHFANAALLEKNDSVAEALMEYDKAVSLAKGKNWEIYKGISLLNQGSIYYNNGNPKSGLDFAGKASRIIREHGDTARIIVLEILTGLCHKDLHEDSDAEKSFLSAFDICKQAGNRAVCDKISGHLAEVYELQGKYSIAKEEYEKLLLSDIPLNDRQLLSYARSLIFTGKTEAAEELLGDLHLSDNAMRVDYYHTMSELRARQGDYKTAYVLKDSLLRYNNLMILEGMDLEVVGKMYEMQFSLAESEHDLAVSEKKNAVKNKIIFSIVLALIVIVSISFIIKKSKEARERNKEHAEELKREKADNDTRQARIEKLLAERTKLYEELNGKEERLQTILELKGNNQSVLEECKRLEEEASDVKDRISEISKEISEQKNDMLKTFLAHHRQCASFCNRMPEMSGKGCQERYEADRNQIVSDYKDDAFMAHLESRINFLMEGLVDYVRKELRMSDDMVRLLIYEICGFNYNGIALLLGITPGNAAVRRTRLKNRIQEIREEKFAEAIRRYTCLFSRDEKISKG